MTNIVTDIYPANDSFVICTLPRAGLGNKLLIWARAFVFARLNHLPLLVSPWAQLSIGSLLRFEKEKRLYFDCFVGQGWRTQLKRLYLEHRYPCIDEPEIAYLNDNVSSTAVVYKFSTYPHWSDLFRGLKSHRDMIRREIWQMLTRKHRQKLDLLTPPLISVHIRRGDFRELHVGENFARVGLVRTPITYFVNLIHAIRCYSSASLPITVFSDGHEAELQEVLDLPHVQLMQGNAAIVDLLLMSQSKLIIFSASSTFSYWAGFLSDAAILHHPDHYHGVIRDVGINNQYFEGAIADSSDVFPELLIKNIHDFS